ncbi:MAG: hypothetical protein ACYDHT_02390 [Solirubrobacteraceae bacterium]
MSTTINAPKDSEQSSHVCQLGSYQADDGTSIREVVALATSRGSVLIVDRLAETLGDARLVARLYPNEPYENARIVSEMYLADETRGCCRRLTDEDWIQGGVTDPASSRERAGDQHDPLLDGAGRLYRIAIVYEPPSFSELRWTRGSNMSDTAGFAPVALREVIAALEGYEPARARTAAALDAIADDDQVSTSRLRSELERIQFSPIVLNRGLREAVQRRVSSTDLTLSEIAIRCGRTKRDRRGTLSGETSWLARRIGALPEGGETQPTRWVHSDTLALIAREGLGLSPNEVEL